MSCRHQPLDEPSGVLEITPDGFPLFRDEGTPGFTPPKLDALLALEQTTLKLEDLQRAGLSG